MKTIPFKINLYFFKRLVLNVFIFSFFLSSHWLYSQTPEGINYQAVARTTSGEMISNQTLDVQISVLQGSMNPNSIVYREIHSVFVGEFGLFNLIIGDGAQDMNFGDFANINWGVSDHYLMVEIDSGSGFQLISTSQLMSVPYALYAKEAENSPPGEDGVSIEWLGEFATSPNNPSLNQAYYNNAQGISYIWNGTQWEIIAQDGQQGPPGVDGNDGQDGQDGQDGISINWLGSFASAPSNPSLNEAYYNTSSGMSFIWDGSQWQMITQDGQEGAQGPPGQDGAAMQWLGSFTSAPANPTENQAYYNQTDGISYIWDGSQWQTLAQDGSANELQQLIYDNLTHDLTITNGNTVNLSPLLGQSYIAGNGIDITAGVISNTGDLDPTNELQDLELTGNTLGLTQSAVSVDLSTLTQNSWSLSGNDANASSFVGTNNNFPLAFRVNGAERMRLMQNGDLGLGLTNPDSKLHLSGTDFQNLKIETSSSSNAGAQAVFRTPQTEWIIGSRNDGTFGNDQNFAISNGISPRLVIHEDGRVRMGDASTSFPAQYQLMIQSSSRDRIAYFYNLNGGSPSSGSEFFGVTAGAGGTTSAPNVGGQFDAFGSSTSNTGVVGFAQHSSGMKRGVYGSASGAGDNYGVYGTATGGTTNWAGYFDNGNVYVNNRLEIGGTSGTASTLKVFHNGATGLATFYNGSSESVMTILNSGSVGIGTPFSTAVGKLHIQENATATDGSAGSFVNIQNLANANSTVAAIRFRVGGTSALNGNFHYKSAIYFSRSGANGEGNLIFAMNEAANSNNVAITDEVMRISSTSRVSIGGINPNAKLHINNTDNIGALRVQLGGQTRLYVAENGNTAFYFNDTPTFRVELSNTANEDGRGRANQWAVYSDQRLKSQRKEIDNAMSILSQLKPLRYFHHNSEYREGDNGRLSILQEGEFTYGLLAQEVHKILPEIVYQPKDETRDLWSMDYTKLSPIMIKAIQEQQQEIDELKKLLIELKQELNELKKNK
jgi:RPA family protein